MYAYILDVTYSAHCSARVTKTVTTLFVYGYDKQRADIGYDMIISERKERNESLGIRRLLKK